MGDVILLKVMIDGYRKIRIENVGVETLEGVSPAPCVRVIHSGNTMMFYLPGEKQVGKATVCG